MKRSEFARLLHRAAAGLRVIGITVCVTISTVPSDAQKVLSQPTAAHDLQSIIDANLLRVAVTRFDLPSFHAHRPDGTLVGAEIEMAQQIGRALGVRVELIDAADLFDAVVDLVRRNAPTSLLASYLRPTVVCTVSDFPNLTSLFATRCYLIVRRLRGKQMGGHQPPHCNDTMAVSG